MTNVLMPPDKKKRSRLTKRRNELGLSQKELGDYVGLSRQAVSNWENDVQKPRLWAYQFEKLAQILQVNLEELIDILENREEKC